jgi:cell division protein FtsB
VASRFKKVLRTVKGFTQRLTIRLLAIASVLAFGQYVLNADSRKEYAAMSERVTEMKKLNSDLLAKNVQLRLEVQAVQHDDRYLEQVARQEFGMVRDDEVVYAFK